MRAIWKNTRNAYMNTGGYGMLGKTADVNRDRWIGVLPLFSKLACLLGFNVNWFSSILKSHFVKLLNICTKKIIVNNLKKRSLPRRAWKSLDLMATMAFFNVSWSSSEPGCLSKLAQYCSKSSSARYASKER